MTNSIASTWVRTKSDERAIDEGCYFDLKAADRVRFFFAKFLRHSKGQFGGQPFELLDWQWSDVIAPLFGWKRANGTRRFRRASIGIPKKNGKSTLLSGIGLYCTMGDGERGAEVYSCAASRQQASIIFNESMAMVEASPALASRVAVKSASKTLEYGKNVYQALSADVPTKEGLNISCLLFDELHAQQTRKLWDSLRYGGAARLQPLLIWISTAGTDQQSICYEQWEYARSVLAGNTIDTELLPVIYEAAPEDDWKAESTWRKANPSYGVTLSASDFAADCQEAQRSPIHENVFKRYRLNLWTAQETRWIQVHRWEKCKATWTPDALVSQPCIVGLDLAATTDFNSAVELYKGKESYRCVPHFWLPESALQTRQAENRDRLAIWAAQGLIKLTEGDTADYEVIRADLSEIATRAKVTEIALDPWNATSLATQLQGDGFDVSYVRTGFYSISAATKEFEKLVLAQQIEHDGNPVLTWMLSNIAVETDASGNLKPSKRRSAEKIDGIVALILALARFIAAKQRKPSKYEKGGLSYAG